MNEILDNITYLSIVECNEVIDQCNARIELLKEQRRLSLQFKSFR